MGNAPERQLTDQGRERKQQILDTATSLFAERGYAQTRIADICEAAGVAKGLFYWYFENKESLFSELVVSMRSQVRRAQAAAMATTEHPIDRLRLAIEAAVTFMAENSAYFSFVENEREDKAVSGILRDSSVHYLDDAERLVINAQAHGYIPEDRDPSLLAVGILGSVATFSHFHRSGRVDLPAEQLAAFVSDWIIRALDVEKG